MRALRIAYRTRAYFSTQLPVLNSVKHKNENFRPKLSYVKQQETPIELIASQDPDEFGLLSRTHKSFTEKYEQDPDDAKEEEFISEKQYRRSFMSTKQYADLIKEHLANKRIKEALDVLEVKMLEEDRAKPENYIYNLLIDGCAQVGYTQKAFKLFNDMKRRGLKTTGATYTSLFNACANSPWPHDGLKRAIGLRTLMAEKAIEPNLTTYNCMVKAFGRCGDLLTAFRVVDEMQSKNIKIRVHTFNFLLQSCISDKNDGFRHALATWRKMLSVREKPNIYSFNLMVRCAKECHIGDQNFQDELSKLVSQPSEQKYIEKKSKINESSKSSKQKCIEKSSHINETSEPESQNRLQTIEETKPVSDVSQVVNPNPNLLSRIPHMGTVVSVGNINTPEDRFMLLGGLDGFIEEMKTYKITPGIVTLTQLLDVIPNTLEFEEKILNFIKENKIMADIDFYNMLIRRRCFRFDYENAKTVRDLITKENKIRKKVSYLKKHLQIKPDIVTYGVLALTCITQQNAEELINEIKLKRIRINAQILGSLIKCGSLAFDPDYVTYIMKVTHEENVKVNQKYMDNLKLFNRNCLNILEGKNPPPDNLNLDEFQEKYNLFNVFYHAWTKNIQAEEEQEHPWTQFKTIQPETFQKKMHKNKPVRFRLRKRRINEKYKVKV